MTTVSALSAAETKTFPLSTDTAAKQGAARTDAAAGVTCYSIHAEVNPGVLPRVLELFAKRDLVPQRWHSDLVTQPGEAPELQIDLQVAGLGGHEGQYIARCLRQIWGVTTVLTSEKRG